MSPFTYLSIQVLIFSEDSQTEIGVRQYPRTTARVWNSECLRIQFYEKTNVDCHTHIGWQDQTIYQRCWYRNIGATKQESAIYREDTLTSWSMLHIAYGHEGTHNYLHRIMLRMAFELSVLHTVIYQNKSINNGLLSMSRQQRLLMDAVKRWTKQLNWSRRICFFWVRRPLKTNCRRVCQTLSIRCRWLESRWGINNVKCTTFSFVP